MTTEKLIVELDAKTQKLDAALKQTDNRLDKLDKQVGKTDKGLIDLGRAGDIASKSITALATAGTAASVAILAATKASVEYAKELEIAANRSGENVETLQEMASATRTVGIDLEKLGDISKDTNEKVGDFLADGKGGFNDFVDVMGLTEEQAQKTAESFRHLSGPEILQEMVTRMESAGIEAKQMSFALEGMASDTTDLIPLLRNGGEEMSRLRERFKETNVVLTQLDIDRLKTLGEQLGGLGDQAQSASSKVVSVLSTELSEVFQLADGTAMRMGELVIRAVHGYQLLVKRAAAEISSLILDVQIKITEAKLFIAKTLETETGQSVRNFVNNALNDLEELESGAIDSMRNAFGDEFTESITKAGNAADSFLGSFSTAPLQILKAGDTVESFFNEFGIGASHAESATGETASGIDSITKSANTATDSVNNLNQSISGIDPDVPIVETRIEGVDPDIPMDLIPTIEVDIVADTDQATKSISGLNDDIELLKSDIDSVNQESINVDGSISVSTNIETTKGIVDSSVVEIKDAISSISEPAKDVDIAVNVELPDPIVVPVEVEKPKVDPVNVPVEVEKPKVEPVNVPVDVEKPDPVSIDVKADTTEPTSNVDSLSAKLAELKQQRDILSAFNRDYLNAAKNDLKEAVSEYRQVFSETPDQQQTQTPDAPTLDFTQQDIQSGDDIFSGAIDEVAMPEINQTFEPDIDGITNKINQEREAAFELNKEWDDQELENYQFKIDTMTGLDEQFNQTVKDGAQDTFEFMKEVRKKDAADEKARQSQNLAVAQTAIRGALALANVFFEDNKALRGALIIADTAAGIVRQFAELPYPAALATSASIAAAGAAQLATVQSTTKGSGSAPTAPTAASVPNQPTQQVTVTEVSETGDTSVGGLELNATNGSAADQLMAEWYNDSLDNGRIQRA